ncbi:radical SAM protein [Acidobacteriota bacterium]
MMHDLKLSKFMYETVAGGHSNQLSISSVCNGKCIFCSNKMNPFTIYHPGFRPLNDIKKGIALLNPNSSQEIRIGDSLPGRISEGEALLHPDIFKVLKLIREKAPNTIIQVNTNGTMLTKDFIKKLIPSQPMRISISYHSNNPKFWRKIFNLGHTEYQTAHDSFIHLAKNKFKIEGVMVPLPSLVGYSDIENSIKRLTAFTNHFYVYLPGYTSKTSSDLKKILDVDYRELSSFLIKMRKKYRIDIEVPSDLLKPISFSPYKLMLNSYYEKRQNVLWLISEGAYKQARKILKDFNPFLPNEHFAYMVKNNTYRGNIICAGLLMVSDFKTAAKKAKNELIKKGIKISLIILPKISFDRFGDDLKGVNYSELIDEFQVPIWLG